MLIKRIRAQTLSEALERVRTECGDNALLIETRKTNRGYLIIATDTDSAVETPVCRSAPRSQSHPRWTQGFAPLAEIALEFGLGTPPLRAVEKALIGTRVDLSRPGDPALPEVCARILKALIRTESLAGVEHRILALVGPTGVGKTTTLAKLAARAIRDRDETVAIITIDTYRVAAVEQLRAFAEMLRVPFQVAFTPMDLRRAVGEYEDVDRIFIDTTGRSPHDGDCIGTLRGTLESANPGVALCLAAGTRRQDGISILRGFDSLESDCLIITKWDETHRPGESVSLGIEYGLPIARITTGQEVPEDIVMVNDEDLAHAVFRLDTEHSLATTGRAGHANRPNPEP